MIICGIDPSINSSGIFKIQLDDKTLDIIDQDYLSFTQVKKNECNNILWYKKKDFKNNLEQNIWMQSKISPFIQYVNYLAIEGYAYGATGLVFEIGEFVGGIKQMVYELSIKMRIYEPTVIKMYATGNGTSDKISMCDKYDKLKDGQLDLGHLPQYKSPKEDVVDAYYICKLLRLELMLRKGLITLDKLNETEIKIFNRLTKSNPVNILARDFIGE